jgi:hypothetical protein
MKQLVLLSSILLLSFTSGNAQEKYFTKSGKIVFSSKTSLENIEGRNKSVTCVLDTKSGNLQFAVLMKGFEFEKALMQEHFNENYVESHKFPKAEFKGQVINSSEIDFGKEGTYPAKVRGKLTIHGETKDIETNGKIVVKGDKIEAGADFNIQIADYNITVPSVVKDNISTTVTIAVNCSLEQLKG